MSYMVPKKSKTTSKKVIAKGTVNLYNPITAEVIEEELIQVEDRDFNFTKVFMRNFLNDLDVLANKKLKVAIYIIENVDNNSYFHGTIRQIANKLGFSTRTVEDTIKVLLDADFMRRVTPGAYRINVDHIYKGSHKNRLRIAHEYYKEPEEKLTIEEQIENYEKMIDVSMREWRKRVEELKKEWKKKHPDSPDFVFTSELENILDDYQTWLDEGINIKLD